MLNINRYVRKPVVALPERTWPSREIKKAPIWCSVDLRDGNQALIDPMVVEEKLEFFRILQKLGFKEIEVGFPAASQIEFDFLRTLAESGIIAKDVTVQVLTQCREEQVARTFEAIQGIDRVIFHIYNSTSALQRDVVFHSDRAGITRLATDAARQVKEYERQFSGTMIFEYSPESFTETELDYALEISTAVQEVWQPTKEKPMILNLPATVETNTPNVYADQIEYISTRLKNRDSVILSCHPHNDRGTGVAIAELALLAGAQRIEGTLFGNGERSGNVDILTLAYNLFSQGIDPQLAIEDVTEIKRSYERLCKMPVPDRHPYAGKLVFTAFSGSHQDAINKGMQAMQERNSTVWRVPYLPIDPADIGRQYESVVRINSQSGKGGIAFIMENYFGFKLPKAMHKEFADWIQPISEAQGEVSPQRIMQEFKVQYLDRKEPYHFRRLRMEDVPEENDMYHTLAEVTYTRFGEERTFVSRGNGPIDAVKRGLEQELQVAFCILDYSEHSLKEGSNAQAAAYVHILDERTQQATFGVGVSSNITRASIRAMFCALNRLTGKGTENQCA